MRRVREILKYRFEQGLGHKAIALRVGAAPSTVRETLRRAANAGLSWPLAGYVSDAVLEASLYKAAGTKTGHRRCVEPDWAEVHRELKRKHVTLQILWDEYIGRHPDGYRYSRFCDLYGGWAMKLPVTMRQDHIPGDKLFVDYAGDTVTVIVDRLTGKTRQAHLFVAVLGASSLSFAQARWSETLPAVRFEGSEETMFNRLSRLVAGCATVFASLLLSSALAFAADALSSWNDGATKQAIIGFVTSVTQTGSKQFVPAEDRVAVFDNDGTLWTEQPIYFQFAFMLDRVKALAPKHPEWKHKEPFRSILAGDMAGLAKSGEKGMIEVGMETHAGMTSEQFTGIVRDWFAASKHPRFGRPYDEITFLPMRELLDYLRANGFKTYIVSGGGIEFMRPVAEKMYGIPPEQVIGSYITTKYALRDGKPVLQRERAIGFVDDGPGKPVGINTFIDRRPIFVAGNSDGDYEMLRWVTAGDGPRLGIIVHHTDETREYAYDRRSHVGRLNKALTEAPERGWVVVDMKADWKRVFSFETDK
jgi:phosphoglycolate phosphatase-like HAD superfamily hydrolase